MYKLNENVDYCNLSESESLTDWGVKRDSPFLLTQHDGQWYKHEKRMGKRKENTLICGLEDSVCTSILSKCYGTPSVAWW